MIPEVLLFYRARRGSLVRARGYREHDLLLSRMLDKHHLDLPEDLRQSLKVYIQVASELRGLGAGSLFLSEDGMRSRLVEAVRALYLRWLKEFAVQRFSERRRRQVVSLVKRWLGYRPRH